MSAAAAELTRFAPTLKGEARRQRLLETAADAFLEFGYADVSMQEIVRQAGGSASTAYQSVSYTHLTLPTNREV